MYRSERSVGVLSKDSIKDTLSNYKFERADIIKQNMPLVGYVANRFRGRGFEYDDLYQYGCIGLIKAVDRFDPNYGVAFSTYAVPLIIGEIRKFIRSDGSIHVSRTIKENAHKILGCIEIYSKKGEIYTIDDLCKSTGLEKNSIVIALTALAPIRSLNEPIGGEGELILQDTIGKDEGDILTNHIALEQALSTLPLKEKELIFRRYFKRHTQSVIASELGLTQVQISRLEKKILAKLRSQLDK